jgi:YidC/Oxa1 family membrane protein insertase
MWNQIVIDPFVNSLIWIYGFLGGGPGSYGWAILLLTLIIRLALLPLTMKQQKSAAVMQELQPKIKALQEKYKNDPENLQKKTMELYKEHGANPLGGCLPTLIQFPILIGFYRAITQSLAASPIQLIELSQHLYQTAPAWLPPAASLIPLNSTFLGMNLATPPASIPQYIVPLLVVGTTWLQQKLLTPPNTNPDPQQAAMTQSMQVMMPLMVGMFSLQFPIGLSIYWIAANFAGLVQAAIMGRLTWDSFKNLINLTPQEEPTGRRGSSRGRAATSSRRK